MVLTLINEALGYYFISNYERSIDALLQAEHYISGPQSHFYLELQIFENTFIYEEKDDGYSKSNSKKLESH